MIKTWFDHKFSPHTHAPVGVTTQFASALFAGNGALKADPTQRFRQSAIATFTGTGAFKADTTQLFRQTAIATFAGIATFSGDTSQKGRLQAIATFAGVAMFSAVALSLVPLQAIATFAGIGSLLVTLNPRFACIASFAGISSFNAIGSGVTRQSAVATFAGTGNLSAKPGQRITATAKFAGAGLFTAVIRLRLLALARFAGTGIMQSIPVRLPQGAAIPRAPVLTLASTGIDTKPDFFVDLPGGLGDGTDAAVDDVLALEYSNNGGSTYNSYLNHPLVAADFVNATINETATALAPGSYLFRAKLVRATLSSNYSTAIADTITINLSAPTALVLVSTNPDTNPNFFVGLQNFAGNATDAAIGDTVVGQYSSDGGVNFSSAFSYVLVAADVTLGGINATSVALANGNYLYRARVERGAVVSSWTANVAVTVIAGSQVPTAAYLRSVVDRKEIGIGGNDVYTTLLLHGDGTNGSTTIPDSSAGATVAHIITPYNGAVLSTAIKKFGTASIALLTTNARLDTPTSGDFRLSTNDFTVDWFEYRTASAFGSAVIARDGTTLFTPWIFGIDDGVGFARVFISSDGATWDIANNRSLGSIILNQQVHRAVVRSGQTFLAFQDGAITDQWTSAAAIFGNPNPLSIGFCQNQFFYTGYIDELRISNGIARWTTTFTPPIAQYNHQENGRLRAQSNKG